DFLSDVWTICEQCHGKRYKKEILEVYFQAYNINDTLNLSCEQALSVFKSYPQIQKKLQVLNDVGLGYIKLGQATSTLSGGETQRLKLAYKLQAEQPANTLFIFDEPSTGLHMQDVENLISVLNKLVGNGQTVIVIEHNTSIIQAADWIIDLGPDGGDTGGDIVYNGWREGLISCD
ncbi:MAG: excinuclease ABC subunit A, partial [Bacteroidales bacterium]|nr:excinuclease ABC subunit A [Bacteroidales bacterium]